MELVMFSTWKLHRFYFTIFNQWITKSLITICFKRKDNVTFKTGFLLMARKMRSVKATLSSHLDKLNMLVKLTKLSLLLLHTVIAQRC